MDKTAEESKWLDWPTEIGFLPYLYKKKSIQF